MNCSDGLRGTNSAYFSVRHYSTDHDDDLASEQLIERQIGEKRKRLLGERQIDRDGAEQIVGGHEERIGTASERARVQVDIVEDVEHREGKIGEKKVDIESHDGHRELMLASIQRSRRLLRRHARLVENLVQHDQIEDDHENERRVGAQHDRDHIGR